MILVTGATGTFGTALVPYLVADGHPIRALSRRPQTLMDPDPVREPDQKNVAWVTGDLATGVGLDEAVTDVDVIIHAASDVRLRGSQDAESTKHLLSAAKRRGMRPHVLYISIVGVGRLPYAYYRAKLHCERLIQTSGLPHTILRTTQWHQLLDRIFGITVKSPVMPVPSSTALQPLDVSEAARRMAELAAAPAAGRAEDFGGPEVLPAKALAASYAYAAGKRRAVLPVWIPGASGKAFREGFHLAPQHAHGKVTWAEFLEQRFAVD